MNLLGNPIVKKYFGCKHFEQSHPMDGCTSLAILTAMEEPIKKGERYLGINSAPTIEECEAGVNWPGYQWHPYALRLPDAHQKKECDGIQTWKDPHCPGCTATQVPRKPWFTVPAPESGKCSDACQGTAHYAAGIEGLSAPEPEKCDCGRAPWQDHGRGCLINGPRPSAVEAAIKEISRHWSVPPYEAMALELRALVELAKKENP